MTTGVTLEALLPRLRQLRLSGLRHSLLTRTQEARSRGLDPLEFLGLLLDDELARREAERVTRAIARAHFEDVCDLRDFDFTYNPEVPKARLWDLATGRFTPGACLGLAVRANGGWQDLSRPGLGRPGLSRRVAGPVLQNQCGARGSGRWPGGWQLADPPATLSQPGSADP